MGLRPHPPDQGFAPDPPRAVTARGSRGQPFVPNQLLIEPGGDRKLRRIGSSPASPALQGTVSRVAKNDNEQQRLFGNTVATGLFASDPVFDYRFPGLPAKLCDVRRALLPSVLGSGDTNQRYLSCLLSIEPLFRGADGLPGGAVNSAELQGFSFCADRRSADPAVRAGSKRDRDHQFCLSGAGHPGSVRRDAAGL